MNKLLIFTTCITPLILMNADAKYSASNFNSNPEKSIEISKPSDAKLDQYMRIKCNLPKISDQQARAIANNAIRAIIDIQQNISENDITKSLQKYCVKDSVFGKVIEIAQDLVPIAKTHADFRTVIRLERISSKALDLYNREGINFGALANGETNTFEYRENEELFKKFMSEDLMILRDIALQYGNLPAETSIIESRELTPTADRATDMPVFETETSMEPAPVVAEAEKPVSNIVDNETESFASKAIEEKEAVSEKSPVLANSETSDEKVIEDSKSIEPAFVESPISEASNVQKIEENTASVNETTLTIKPDPVENITTESNSEPITPENQSEISQEKPVDINPFSPIEESRNEDKQPEGAPYIMPPQEIEENSLAVSSNNNRESSEIVNNEENGNPLLPHYFDGKKSEQSESKEETQKAETPVSEQNEPSEKRRSFWGF